MKFFFDSTFAWQLVEFLKVLDVDAVHSQEVFAEGTLDEDWIPEVADKGWVAVTGDNKIWNKRAQRAVVQQHKLKIVFMPDGFAGWKRWPQVQFIIRYWPEIEQGLGQMKQVGPVQVTLKGHLRELD